MTNSPGSSTTQFSDLSELSELIVYMLPHRHEALSRALYGPEYGTGERELALEMVSGYKHITLKIPIICKYADNAPYFVTDKISGESWVALCKLVAEERRLQIIFHDGKKDHLAKAILPGSKPPKDGGIEMSLRWQESDEAKVALQRGVAWLKDQFT